MNIVKLQSVAFKATACNKSKTDTTQTVDVTLFVEAHMFPCQLE